MINYEMHPYTLQSYFKNMCKSAYLAHEQLKRIRENQQKVETELMRMRQELLGLDSSCSEEELKKKTVEISVYKAKSEILRNNESFWGGSFNRNKIVIDRIISEIEDQHFQIIVTSKEEIFGLMIYYMTHEGSEDYYDLINTKENFLDFFFKEEMYTDFIYTYWEKNSKNMKTVFEEYF